MLRITLAFLVVVFSTCAGPDSPLDGHWQAVVVTDGDGDTLRLDPSQINFHFLPDGRYRYLSTIGYEEAGTYTRSGNRLIARDTTGSSNAERVVAIVEQSADTLQLRWLNGEEKRLLTLVRQ